MMLNSFVDNLSPSARVPGTMKKRVANANAGTAVPGVMTSEVAQQVVAGVTAEQLFDLPMSGDGVRRTAVQSWWAGGQLKVKLHRASTANLNLLLEKSVAVLAEIGKGEDPIKGET